MFVSTGITEMSLRGARSRHAHAEGNSIYSQLLLAVRVILTSALLGKSSVLSSANHKERSPTNSARHVHELASILLRLPTKDPKQESFCVAFALRKQAGTSWWHLRVEVKVQGVERNAHKSVTQTLTAHT